MRDHVFTVELTLAAPVVSQGIGGRRLGLDTVFLRNGDRRPALPGSLVRGHLREAWELFAKLSASGPDWARWLGKERTLGSEDDAPKAILAGRLRFDDYWVAQDAGEPDGICHRISISPATGTVARGALQFIESPYAPGKEITFSGDIAVTLEPEEKSEIDLLNKWLTKGFKYLDALGGLKGVGFGRLIKAQVAGRECPPDAPIRISPQRAGEEAQSVVLRFGIALAPEGLLCFPRPGPKRNRYVSEEYIPGAAIKAAMAQRVKKEQDRFPLLDRYFDDIHATHALPVPAGHRQRPLNPPFSLAFGPKLQGAAMGTLYDLALKPNPGLLSGKAPLFQPDWKDAHRRAAALHCGWVAAPARRLTVRNKIDTKTGTVHIEEDGGGSLYSVEALVPDRHHWLANICIPDVAAADEANLVEEFTRLFAQGLVPLGRTHVRARVISADPFAPAGCVVPLVRSGERVVLLLQSLALLLPPEFMPQPTNDGHTLREAYRESLRELSEGALELDWFFARQRLLGGEYWWKRFRKKKPDDRYRPLVASLPGSVFACRVAPGKAAKAEDCLRRWQWLGLPQLKAIPGGDDWKQNPWIAQNGYGEVIVNAGLHWDRCPPEGVWDEL